MTTNKTPAEKLQDLDMLIAKLRYVKYGDIWLSADHNDVVDCIKVLREICAQLIGAVTCPSGEQITNGGFETGDLTGWTVGSTWAGEPPAVTSEPVDGVYPHSGNYMLWFHHTTGAGGYIEQEVSIRVACVKKFSLWKCGMCPYSPPAGSQTRITIYYSDGTTTEVIHETSYEYDHVWEEIDLRPYLESGKTITKIRIERYDSFGGWFHCYDDISLEGTG